MGSPVLRVFLSAVTGSAICLLAWMIGCSPISGGPGTAGKHPPLFIVVVHNQSIAFAETATVTWWQASSILGKRSALIPANAERSFLIGPRPDGIEVDTDTWPAQAGGRTWGSPDYVSGLIFHIYSPNGASRVGP